MKQTLYVLVVLLIVNVNIKCFAVDCANSDCGFWYKKGGYCVAYVRTRIPSLYKFKASENPFAINIPKNKETKDVEIGDAAIFAVGDFGHIAYVEKVNRDQNGNATSIDISEKNYGGPVSFDDFKKKWKINSQKEHEIATRCCGVTSLFDEERQRKEVPINKIDHIWSPFIVRFEKGLSDEQKVAAVQITNAILSDNDKELNKYTKNEEEAKSLMVWWHGCCEKLQFRARIMKWKGVNQMFIQDDGDGMYTCDVPKDGNHFIIKQEDCIFNDGQ